jgi:hypothetical protein
MIPLGPMADVSLGSEMAPTRTRSFGSRRACRWMGRNVPKAVIPGRWQSASADGPFQPRDARQYLNETTLPLSGPAPATQIGER